MTNVPNLRVLLFDIDGTLLLSGGAGGRSLERAIKKITGRDGGMNDVLPDGKTDYLIIEEAFRVNFPALGLGPKEIEATLELYLDFLEDEVADSKGFRLMPGVPEILDACRDEDRILLGLATGNLEEGAEIKMERAGLWHYFSFGGFGSDAIQRTDMVRVAVRRANETVGAAVPAEQIFVIGDTPHDILCAHEAGVRAIGVGASRFSCEELAHHKPDFLLEDLTSPKALFKCLGM